MITNVSPVSPKIIARDLSVCSFFSVVITVSLSPVTSISIQWLACRVYHDLLRLCEAFIYHDFDYSWIQNPSLVGNVPLSTFNLGIFSVLVAM